jgi:hypothetical protein
VKGCARLTAVAKMVSQAAGFHIHLVVGDAMSAGHIPKVPRDARRRLERQLWELDTTARRVGKHALLYCARCRSVIPYARVLAGPIQDWPYCPIHKELPLTVRAESISLQACVEVS